MAVRTTASSLSAGQQQKQQPLPRRGAAAARPATRPAAHPAAPPAARWAALLPPRAAAPQAAGGFGRSNKKKVNTEGAGLVVPKEGKRVSRADLADDKPTGSARKAAGAGAPAGFPENWIDLGLTPSDVPVGKSTKAVELAAGRVLIVYKFEDRVYVSDANSTAYQYPMLDARVFRDAGSGAVAAEVALDGTVYDLATGAVLKWCPKDNPMRSLLGTLKSNVNPSPLKVYPVHLTPDGNIWTKLL